MRLTAKPQPFAGAVLSPKHARELSPNLSLAIAAALRDSRRVFIPYTLWITEAWGVLGWAEPSAALFWEMATMYHALYLAGREEETPSGGDDMDQDSINAGNSNTDRNSTKIPPILSCGSHSSLGSQNDKKKQYGTAGSAKELPVWLVGTFLLLHCEEFASGLAGPDQRRFAPNTATLDFNSLLQLRNMSSRNRLAAGAWKEEHLHCTSFLLRHLRKVLLLTAVPHNEAAMGACMHLSHMPTGASKPTQNNLYSLEWLDKVHKEEHGQVGTSVRLSMDDLEKLHFVLQQPSGGGVDDLPMDIGAFLWESLYPKHPMPPNATLSLGDVEREIRRRLEGEIVRVKGSGADPSASSTELQLDKLSLDDDEDDTDIEGEFLNTKGYEKELTYTNLRGTTIMLKPETGSDYHPRLHDLVIAECSDAHFYLLQPFEHVTIASCTGCTIVVGAVAGLLHIVDCEKTQVTSAVRRLLVSNSTDVLNYSFTPSPPLLVGDNRNCQLGPYNTYYEGLREDLLATGLAAAVSSNSSSSNLNISSAGASPVTSHPAGAETIGGSGASAIIPGSPGWPPLQCASNKWKQPVELSKLELPQVGGTSTGASSVGSTPSPAAATATTPATPTAAAGSDPMTDPSLSNEARNLAGNNTDDAAMQTPILLPPSDFHVLFCPVLSPNLPIGLDVDGDEETDDNNDEPDNANSDDPVDDIDADKANNNKMTKKDSTSKAPRQNEAPYCKVLSHVLQYSPFRLPIEYERQTLVKADRMRNLQTLVKKTLNEEQQQRFEEELNRGFREWLVSSGNLRQVLDLVHMEREEQLAEAGR